ncbi:lytic polysaccharide monooxygenase [Burkholderia ubonensis]|nr:lytic polysaccharide monooxygenase [Burkholderia ubonensis]
MKRLALAKRNVITLAPIVLAGGMLFAQNAMAHGYVQSPPSRNYKCWASYPGKDKNNCGADAIQWEPQSLEAASGNTPFPVDGPRDKELASANGTRGHALDEQTSERWTKTDVTPGPLNFTWHFTAGHPARYFHYFITKKGWNPNAPLTRDQFESQPFCVKEYGTGSAAKNEVSQGTDTMTCTIPSDHSGYNVIYAEWKVDNTANSFWNAIDVNIKNGDPGPGPAPITWNTVGTIYGTGDLAPGDQVSTRVFNATDTMPSLSTSITIKNDTEGNRRQWPMLLAEQINKVRGASYQAGQNQDGVIKPVPGNNTIFARKGSEVRNVEIDIKKHQTPQPEQEMHVTANSEYAIQNNVAVVEPYVTLRKKAVVSATLYSNDGTRPSVGTNSVTVDGAAKIPVTVSNARAGNYTLVVTSDGVDQQSSAIKLTGGDSGGQGNWDPRKSYQGGEKVQWKGNTYTARWWSQGHEPGLAAYTCKTGTPNCYGKEWDGPVIGAQ